MIFLDVEGFIDKHKITREDWRRVKITKEMIEDAKQLDIKLSDYDYLTLLQKRNHFELHAICGCKLEKDPDEEINPMAVVHLVKMLSFYDMRVKDVPVEIRILAYNIDLTKYEDCRLDLLPSVLEFVKAASR